MGGLGIGKSWQRGRESCHGFAQITIAVVVYIGNEKSDDHRRGSKRIGTF